MVLSRAMLYWVNTLDYPMWIFAGFLFPVALLPGWTTPLSFALAPYWLADALHRAVDGASPAELAPTWAVILGLSAAYLALSGAVFRVVLRRARVTAELALF
jgi:ABC-2 type transport system permease protein